jgi:excisionase family DNA binding protein
VTQFAAPVPEAGLPLFLEVEEAAKLIGIGRSTAYDLVRRGDIPTVRFGRRIRVPRGALLALAGFQEGGGRDDAA